MVMLPVTSLHFSLCDRLFFLGHHINLEGETVGWDEMTNGSVMKSPRIYISDVSEDKY